MPIEVSYYVSKDGSVSFDQPPDLDVFKYPDVIEVIRSVDGFDECEFEEDFKAVRDNVFKKDPSMWATRYNSVFSDPEYASSNGWCTSEPPEWWTEKHDIVSDKALVDYLDRNIYSNQRIVCSNGFNALFASDCDIVLLGSGSVVGNIYGSTVGIMVGNARIGNAYNTSIGSMYDDSSIDYLLGESSINSLSDYARVYCTVPAESTIATAQAPKISSSY